MNVNEERTPFEGISTSEDVLIENPRARLGELVDNDPDAPLMASVPSETSLAFSVKELVGFAGRFPREAAFFAIAAFACVVIACCAPNSSDSQNGHLPLMGMLLVGALIAQAIEGKSDKA